MLPETTILTAIISPTSEDIVTTNDKSCKGPDPRNMQIAVVESDENSQMRCAVIKLEHNLGDGSMKTHKDGNKSNTTSKISTNSLGAEDGIGSWWAGPVALVRSSCMRKIMCLLVTIYFLQGIVYLGLPLSSNSFSSPFLYMMLLGVVGCQRTL
nr:uncharacterized protein LOC128692955 [Cherax quadricarinatus]